jgi:hypothetical protein
MMSNDSQNSVNGASKRDESGDTPAQPAPNWEERCKQLQIENEDLKYELRELKREYHNYLDVLLSHAEQQVPELAGKRAPIPLLSDQSIDEIIAEVETAYPDAP